MSFEEKLFADLKEVLMQIHAQIRVKHDGRTKKIKEVSQALLQVLIKWDEIARLGAGVFRAKN
jgi:hypothetical protein